MQEPCTPGSSKSLARAERLVVLQVAAVPRGRTREQLTRLLRGIGQRRVEEAIANLAAVGVVIVAGSSIRQSSALEHIDKLGLIGV